MFVRRTISLREETLSLGTASVEERNDVLDKRDTKQFVGALKKEDLKLDYLKKSLLSGFKRLLMFVIIAGKRLS